MVYKVRKDELEEMVNKERSGTSLADILPESITNFLVAFESLDISQQEVHIQSILKAVHIYPDGCIELEFRDMGSFK